MLCGGNGKPEGREFSPLFSPRSSSSRRSNRRIVVKRQATVAALVVSSVALSGCAAEVGSRSASEDAAMTAEADGTSSVDGAGDANGNQGDDVEDNAGDSEHSKDEDTSAGAGLRGETGATADGDSGVLPSPGEFDPADPDFKLFDPCTEIASERLEEIGLEPKILDYRNESGHYFCNIASNGRNFSENILVSVASDSTSFEELGLNEDLRQRDETADSEGIHLFNSELFKESQCNGYLSTSRGTIIIGINDVTPKSSQVKRCQLAAEIITNLKK